MKKTLLIATLIIISSLAKAQDADTTYWDKGGNYAFNFTQVSLSNWASGGQNAVSGVTKLQLFANYNKANTSWENRFDVSYGLSKIEGQTLQKSEDIIDLQSKLGIKASENWFYSASLAFKSQFAPGYSYADGDTTMTSNLFAPADLLLALGMDYKPNEMFSAMISPVTGKMTIVADDSIDETSYGLDEGATTRLELGASIKAMLNIEVVKNVGLTSELGLFSNYIDSPQNVDIDWKVSVNMKINDYLSASIDTRMIYDDDIKIDGSPKIQFKEILGIGFNVKF
ncbi:MAG: DUF3078 domain-containing protein [Prolixibacteraceae bacterium]|nr:DUF3078 domain-containing protein [Prolixibacteraceae bacterium]